MTLRLEKDGSCHIKSWSTAWEDGSIVKSTHCSDPGPPPSIIYFSYITPPWLLPLKYAAYLKNISSKSTIKKPLFYCPHGQPTPILGQCALLNKLLSIFSVSSLNSFLQDEKTENPIIMTWGIKYRKWHGKILGWEWKTAAVWAGRCHRNRTAERLEGHWPLH